MSESGFEYYFAGGGVGGGILQVFIAAATCCGEGRFVLLGVPIALWRQVICSWVSGGRPPAGGGRCGIGGGPGGGAFCADATVEATATRTANKNRVFMILLGVTHQLSQRHYHGGACRTSSEVWMTLSLQSPFGDG